MGQLLGADQMALQPLLNQVVAGLIPFFQPLRLPLLQDQLQVDPFFQEP
jgi:hypothetical protein